VWDDVSAWHGCVACHVLRPIPTVSVLLRDRVGQIVEVGMRGNGAFGGDEGDGALRVFNPPRSTETTRMLGKYGCGIGYLNRGQ